MQLDIEEIISKNDTHIKSFIDQRDDLDKLKEAWKVLDRKFCDLKYRPFEQDLFTAWTGIKNIIQFEERGIE